MRTPTISSATYAPGVVPETYSAHWLRDELDRLRAAIDLIAAGHIDKTYAEPAKPREGDIRYADGTTWDPGWGEGIYRYNGSAWVLLG